MRRRQTREVRAETLPRVRKDEAVVAYGGKYSRTPRALRVGLYSGTVSPYRGYFGRVG
jgi:hypothetical protein